MQGAALLGIYLNEPIDRDDLRLKRSCRNEMASTDRDMILCDRE